jgi:Transposase DDE domain
MVVTVADRESDIYEFLLEAQAMNAKYVIRACYDRHLHQAEYDRLPESLRRVEGAGTVEIDVPTQNRRALLELRFVPLALRPPERMTRWKTKWRVSCWVIQVCETVAPAGSDPLTWTLLTNLPVTSLEQALERISWYRRRWQIEMFHKILKSGCTVEDGRLQTAERLTKYIALIAVMGWRIFWMVPVSRADPSAPADIALTKTEIATLCSLQRFQSKLLQEKFLTSKPSSLSPV